MNELLIYLLKVSGGLAIVAVPCYLVLRNDPNLGIKRYYLLLGVLAAWIIPLISFHRPDLVRDLVPAFFIDPTADISLPSADHAPDSPSSREGPGWLQVTMILYLTGLALILFRNLAVLLRWNRAWKKADRIGRVAYTSANLIFTLFNRIFIPGSFRDQSDLETLLLHEKAHVRQLHFIDLTIMELTLILTWFNPFSWLISRMMKENHEHLADRTVLLSGISPALYRAQLLNQTLGVPVFRLGTPFNHSITFKRFNMMKKPSKSTAGFVKFLILVPAVLATLALTTGTAQFQKQVKGKVLFADTGEPAPGTNIVTAGSTLGTITGPDGTFHMDVEGNPEIVLSFVGYKTVRIKASKAGRKPILLEQGVFELDPERGTDHRVSIHPYKVTSEQKEPVKEPRVTQPKPEPFINSKGEEVVFFVVEDMPMFPGGKDALANYIYSHLVYPESAKRRNLEGEVHVQFTVTTSGRLDGIKAVSSTDPVFVEPALEVFRYMPDWNPGKQRNKLVKAQVVVPVRFRPGEE